MKTRSMGTIGICMISLLLAGLPATAGAEPASTPPPISQPMVTEGTLAVSLVSALGVSSTTDEVAAENSLGDIGIAPRNGWVADYPVTPDIAGEVRESVAAAADAGKLTVDRDEALKRYGDVIAGFDLTVRPYTAGESALDRPVSCDTYPNPATINSAYSGEGPPVVTYYCPPPDYYAQYDWVPYPFWWADFWFPGFFILRDFDRHVHVRHHFVHISNHFKDVKRHRMHRIDPVDRFHGRTFPGIGARHSRGSISTGVPHGSSTVFNPRHGGSGPSGRGETGTFLRSGPPAAPSPGGDRGSVRSGGTSGSAGTSGMRSGGNSGSGGNSSMRSGGSSGTSGMRSGGSGGSGGMRGSGGGGGMRGGGGGMRR